MTRISRLLVTALLTGLVAAPAGAFMNPPLKDHPQTGAPLGSPLGAQTTPGDLPPLPDLKGVVSWKTLAEVQSVKVKNRVVPQFSGNVEALDRKEVRLQGFMMPLEVGERQKHFVLSSMPQTCSFCLPGGPEALVEVRSKTPVKVSFEPLVISGRLSVLKDNPNGLYYRLTDATVVPVR